jgi:hypothetical protein
MAYVSDETGPPEVYVCPFPGSGGKWPISQGGGQDPLWARNGKQLFFRSWTQVGLLQVWVVDIRTDGDFSVSKPRLLFEKPGYLPGSSRNWDISSDDQRFLMVTREEPKLPPVTEMILVQNWFEELKRLSTAGKKK